MKQPRTIKFVILLVIIGFALPMQANAADETQVAQVYVFNTHGNTAAWLEGVKPIIARLKVLNPKQNIHIHESQLAGTGVGTITLVAEHSSMAYMEEMRIKNEGDKEVARLFAAMADIEVDLESRSLIIDRAPDQVRSVTAPVDEVYGIDTHGNNGAYIEGSKKLHELIYKKIPDVSVRMWEAMFAGENSGMIFIVVGYQSMADMERISVMIEDDNDIQKLFAERDKIGATIVSRSLSANVTP